MRLIIADEAYDVKKTSVEEISKYYEKEILHLGNDGNMTKFTNFLKTLFATLKDPLLI